MQPIAATVPIPSFPAVTAVTPIHFIGDSNVLAFHNLLVDVPGFFPQPIVTSAYYLTSLTVRSLHANGGLEGRVRGFVHDHVLAEPYEKRAREEFDADVSTAREFRARTAPPADDVWNIPRDPTVVIMAGTLDLLSLVSTIGCAADFYCDDPAFRPEAFVEPALPLVPRDAVVELVERQLAPLGPALRALKDLGIRRLYLHNVHPPTVDDREYCSIRGAVCSARLRYKVTIEINRVFRRTALHEDVGFLDLWNATTRGGTLDPRFRHDGDHLNRAAARLTLEALLNDLAVRRAQPLEA